MRADRHRFRASILLVAAAAAIPFLQDGADERPFLVNLSNAFGFVAIGLLALQLVIPAGPRLSRGPFRLTLLLRLHRRLGLAALAAAVLHVLLLVVDDVDAVHLLEPLDAPGRARAGLTALLILVVLAVARPTRRGRQSRRWRTVHFALSAAAGAFAVGHVAGVREYLGLDVVTAALLALVPLAALAALYLWPERRHG
jgi:predicted ferric reductase